MSCVIKESQVLLGAPDFLGGDSFVIQPSENSTTHS
jgi:hypothetical protein